MQTRKFYGWWISIAAFFTFGLAVGVPYYAMPFFYDYYEKTFGWSRPDLTFGFPLAATLTLWVGPLLVHRYSPRKLIVVGTGMTALAYLGFATMQGSLWLYYGYWLIYMTGYILSGPIPHQVIISQWFRRHRGKAMAATYLGVGVFGGISAKLIAKPLTDALGFQGALMAMGFLLLLTWPIALFIMRDRPAEMGQQPDGDLVEHAEVRAAPQAFRALLHRPAFWLLVVGSACSIGAIGSINQHMKFVFKEQGFTDQETLNTLFSNATLYILWSSVLGRVFMGWLADRFPKKWVMAGTYALVAGTIPLLLLVRPESPEMVYVFSILFGFGMGADYMLIPLMAAEQFGVNTLARAMAIILPTDTIGQTWFPYLVSVLHDRHGGYGFALNFIFLLAFIGAVAVVLLPSKPRIADQTEKPEPRETASRQ
jgi:MFS family permease